jgi:hypothetical protein
MAEREGLLKRLGKGFDRYIGGLLGEDLSTMTPEERAAARRSAIGIIGRGMVSPEGGSSALTNVMQARAMQRERPMRQRAAQDIQQAQAAIAARMGAGGTTSIGGKAYGIGPDVGEQTQLDEVRPLSGYNLPALLASPAGAAALESNPQLSEMVKQRTGMQVVGADIFNRETGKFIERPKGPKVPIKSEDFGDRKIVYYNDGTRETFVKGVEPKAVPTGALGAGGVKPTKGQEAVDKKFADTIADYVAGGGYADIERQINQLEDVVTRLRSGESLSGPFLASLMENYPNLAAAYNSGAIDVQELVADVAQRNLRAILGGQFAEKEGAQLIKRAYNPALREDINAQRVENILLSMRKANQEKAAAIEYWNKYGTLAGYQGNVPLTLGLSEQPEKKTPPAVGEIRERGGKRFQYLGGDPSSPNSWKIL